MYQIADDYSAFLTILAFLISIRISSHNYILTIYMEKLIPLISDIQQIIRKSDVNLEISLPLLLLLTLSLQVQSYSNTGKSSLL